MKSLSPPDPIPKYQDRQSFRQLLLEGAASEPTKTVDEAYFDTLHERAVTPTTK